jgi:hypothetical protein
MVKSYLEDIDFLLTTDKQIRFNKLKYIFTTKKLIWVIYYTTDNVGIRRKVGNIIFKSGVKIDILLNCNNLKKLNANAENIVESVKDSSVVELSEDKKMIKRKTPFVDQPVVKKVKTEEEKLIEEIKALNPY